MVWKSLKKFIPKSFELRVALAVLLLLVASYAAVWGLRNLRRTDISLSHGITPWRVALEVILILIIPTVLYWALKCKAVVRLGEYPDIDMAWTAGIDALQKKGTSISDKPLFLIL